MTNGKKSCTIPSHFSKEVVRRMKKEDIVKLASKYQAKADKDFSEYQNSGIKQYLYSYHRNEDLAVALRMAVNAADEHQAYIALKIKMAEFMQRAQRIESTSIEFEKSTMIKSLIEDILQYSRLEGLGRET